jgi:hypothetical protein
MSHTAFWVVGLLVSALILRRTPRWDGAVVTAEWWRIIWGNLRLLWIIALLYVVFRLVRSIL